MFYLWLLQWGGRIKSLDALVKSGLPSTIRRNQMVNSLKMSFKIEAVKVNLLKFRSYNIDRAGTKRH